MKRFSIIAIMILIMCLIPSAALAGDSYCDTYGHSWDEYVYGKYYPYNDTHHTHVTAECYICGAAQSVLEPHDFYFDSATKYATPKANGVVAYSCTDCNKVIYKTSTWSYGTEWSTNYDIIDHSFITRNSKTVKVKVKNALKGSKVKVKIGKKTYTKKVKSSSKTIKIKIKKPVKYGQKVKITVTYNGKVIGKDKCDEWDVVWYANKIKVGMTKKQVKYTWGTPESKSSASGGWAFWHYSDGSRVTFRNGKVRSWYDTAG